MLLQDYDKRLVGDFAAASERLVCPPLALRLLGLFGAFWQKGWALKAKVRDPIMRIREH